MKKHIFISFCICALALCGCSGGSETAPATEVSTAAATEASTAAKPAQSKYYDTSSFIKNENGFIDYSDDTTESMRGIDVSSYSGNIEWDKVAAAGVEFAVVRVGGRGYGDEGTLYTDDNLYYNIEQAAANGIQVGAYFYSQAVTEQEAREEADYVINLITEHNISIPVGYDLEHIEDDAARTDSLTAGDFKRNADAFCARLEEKGFETMVYHEYGDGVEPSQREWIAEYEKTPKLSRNVMMWQYSKDGKIDGIEGSVDLNVMFREKQTADN